MARSYSWCLATASISFAASAGAVGCYFAVVLAVEGRTCSPSRLGYFVCNLLT